MADPGGAWDGPSLWTVVLQGIGMVTAFASGLWARGASSGRDSGLHIARMDAVSARMTIIEGRHVMLEDKLSKMDDRIDDKLGKMAERMATTPTRDEMMLMFSRLEAKLDARHRGE